jgi:hypothetical protein
MFDVCLDLKIARRYVLTDGRMVWIDHVGDAIVLNLNERLRRHFIIHETPDCLHNFVLGGTDPAPIVVPG